MLDWERNWRGAGVAFVVLTVVAFFVYGDQPKLGASPAELADLGQLQVTSGLADFAFALTVISCFPAAMFVMSGAFGLSRAGIISKEFFWVGVAAVVLVLLGGTTWASDGFWAPDGAYALIAQIVLFAWIAVLSGFLAMRSPSTAPEPAALHAA